MVDRAERVGGADTEFLPAEGGAIPVTVVRGKPTGQAVVIAPSAFGVAPDLVRQMRELAEQASLAVTFDPFFRREAGVIPYEDFARVRARLEHLDREQTYRDVSQVIAWTKRQSGVTGVIIVGICFGGPFALLSAADGLVSGVVTWHGTRMENFLARASEMRCPMRLHFGSADPIVPISSVETIRAAFAGRADVTVVVHQGATHGFSHPDADKAYAQVAERAAMQSVKDLLRSG